MKLFDLVQVGGTHRSSRNVIVGLIESESSRHFQNNVSAPQVDTAFISAPLDDLNLQIYIDIIHIYIWIRFYL